MMDRIALDNEGAIVMFAIVIIIVLMAKLNEHMN